MTAPVFRSWPKIPRLLKPIVVTEKIDGTNALVCITDSGDVFAGSRSKWITPDDDNHGFAAWVEEHKDELRELGTGYHYGEWWGRGINRNYGLKDRRFSLFNVERWGDNRPACCYVVPVISTLDNLYISYTGSLAISKIMWDLHLHGSKAAPGFMKPEGLVIRHSANGALYKVFCEGEG